MVRFKKTSDGWLDTRTGLEWSKTLGETSWSDAQLLIPKGWRLPTIDELLGIVDYTRSDPSTELPDTQSDCYWSSTSSASSPGSAWYVNFYLGGVSTSSKSYDDYVRGVRGSL